MRDEIANLNAVSKNDKCFIMNIVQSNSSGTHWIAVNIVEGTTYYFDSFGLPPTEEIKRYCKEPRFYNSFVFQKPNEVICGHLCLYFLYSMRKCNKDFNTVLDRIYKSRKTE